MKRQIRSIYIIKNGEGLCKIGISNDPERRLKGLFAGSGSSLCIVYTHEVESNIAFLVERGAHRILGENRKHGEWFDASTPLNYSTLGKHGVQAEIYQLGRKLALAAR